MKWALASATARVFDKKHGFPERPNGHLQYHGFSPIRRGYLQFKLTFAKILFLLPKVIRFITITYKGSMLWTDNQKVSNLTDSSFTQ